MEDKKILEFPEGFLWGTSTSAYQVEGGITNDWSVWEESYERKEKLKKQGKDPRDYVCGRACDSYRRYQEDFDLAKGLNTNAIRFGIEWARLEPQKGKWNEREIAHYHDVLRAAKERGFKVVLTLWHWTSPVWIAAENGWENKKTIKHFLEYVERAAREYGPYVDFWITLNEPTVPVWNGYLKKKFPPGENCLIKARRVMNNLIRAHKKSYQLIHEILPEAQVGITVLRNDFEPARKWNILEAFLAKVFRYFAGERLLSRIQKHMDFIGFDYYFHDRVVWHPPFIKNKNERTTDMGWEIYPLGIYNVLKDLRRHKKPIIVMENGLADAKDRYRAGFIIDHLHYLHQAIQEGADVRGYFYWSLIDNFEWAEGFGPKFGLFAVDRATLARAPRPSASVYAEICRTNSIKVF